MPSIIVGVMGSGKEPYEEFSVPLGKWIAEQNYYLLTGGGFGVMSAVSEAFYKVEGRQGRSVGIVPTFPDETLGFIPKENYPNCWIEIPIITPLPTYDGNDNVLTRNHINILSSDVIVALPGNKGTRNEVELAIKFNKPTILFGLLQAFESYSSEIKRTPELHEVADFIKAVEKRKTPATVGC